MLYIPESVMELHRPYMARAHSERAKMISGLLTGAATGVWNLARWTAGGLGRSGREIISGAVRSHRRSVAIPQLQALDDRLLKDIGLSRSQISVVVDGKLSPRRGARTESAGTGEIAAFPDGPANASSARKSVKRAV